MAGSIQAVPGFSLTPTPSKQALPGNYITNFAFLDQYLPDTSEEEVAIYGDRSIASFLKLVSAELPSDSDLIKWAENGRLHTKYTDVTTATADGQDTSTMAVGGGTCNFRANQVVFLTDGTSDISGKAVISSVTGANFVVEWYEAAGQPTGFQASTAITAYVYGSEFKKGSVGMQGSLEAESTFLDNKPVIIKDKYEVSGSDMTQIGWVYVDGEEAGSGYLWYMKSSHETRMRFDDYLEMEMVEGVRAENGSGAEVFLSDNSGGGNAGTEGLFAAVESRGNIWGGGNPSTLDDFDSMIARLDKQGSIRENVIFNDRQFGNDFSDMVASQSTGSTPSYGLFDNDAEMALELSFQGFSRGYDFYKTDWKYLNDPTLRGGIVGDVVNGILVPTGMTNVYDQVMGEKATRPYLHCRYRMKGVEDRKYKTWLTGSAGGVATSDLDAMEVHYLSERALCTLGANNFVIFKG